MYVRITFNENNGTVFSTYAVYVTVIKDEQDSWINGKEYLQTF